MAETRGGGGIRRSKTKDTCISEGKQKGKRTTQDGRPGKGKNLDWMWWSGKSHGRRDSTHKGGEMVAGAPAVKLCKREHTPLIQTYMHIHFPTPPHLAQTHIHACAADRDTLIHTHTLHPSVVSNSVFLPNTCVIVQLWRMLGNDRGN